MSPGASDDRAIELIVDRKSPQLMEQHSIRAPLLWGVLVGGIQAASPLGFWWLDPATVYALSLALIAAVYIGFAVADGRPRIGASDPGEEQSVNAALADRERRAGDEHQADDECDEPPLPLWMRKIRANLIWGSPPSWPSCRAVAYGRRAGQDAIRAHLA